MNYDESSENFSMSDNICFFNEDANIFMSEMWSLSAFMYFAFDNRIFNRFF